jgi:hypothetical protein
MTAISVTTGLITIELSARRTPALRRLALRAGIVLLTFSGARASNRDHGQQARAIETETAVRRTHEQLRYGFVQ